MPWYVVSLRESIGSSERDELASAITKVHTNLFTTPSLFVNVRFEDASSIHHYVGGKRVSQPSLHKHQPIANDHHDNADKTPMLIAQKCIVKKLVNAIQAHVRAGPSRPRSSYDELCRQLRGAWETALPATPLDLISVHGSLVAGEEKGFLRPEAGHDAEWVTENMAEFERLAASGDEEMRALVEECRSRGLGT